MNKFYLYSIALLTMMLGFVACSDSDDNYTPATVQGPQVFFDKALATKIDLKSNETSFSVPVSRYVTTEALTVGIELTDTNNVFTAPTEVTFAAGDSVANLVISYDPAVFEFNDYKSATLTIKDNTTAYGNSTFSFKAGVALTWKSLGKGTYVDNWFEHTAELPIEVCEQNTNRFRIAKPYASYDGDDYFNMTGTMDDYLEFTVLHPGDVYNDVTITQDGLVVFPIYSTGAIHPSYTDDVVVMMHPSEYSSMAADETAWAHNAVKEWAADGTPSRIQLAPSYYMMKYGGWNYTQEDGMVEIYFPGNAPIDYDLEVAYLGKTVSPDNEYAAQFSVTMGKDLESVKYALVSGNDPQAALNGILDGSIEAESIEESGEQTFAMEKAGTYTFIAVGYAEGEAQAMDFETILFEMGGGETWTAVAAGVYTYGAQALTENASSAYEGTEKAVLYQSSVDENRYRIAPWAHWSSNGLVFTWNKESNKLTTNADTGENFIEEGTDYGRIFFADLVTIDPDSYGAYPSTYDPETKTFEFLGAYLFGDYWMGAVAETFKVTDEAATTAESRSKMAAKHAKKGWKAHKMRYDRPVSKR